MVERLTMSEKANRIKNLEKLYIKYEELGKQLLAEVHLEYVDINYLKVWKPICEDEYSAYTIAFEMLDLATTYRAKWAVEMGQKTN